jgi:hypothetical protein
MLAPSPSKMPCSRFARDARNGSGFAQVQGKRRPRIAGLFFGYTYLKHPKRHDSRYLSGGGFFPETSLFRAVRNSLYQWY